MCITVCSSVGVAWLSLLIICQVLSNKQLPLEGSIFGTFQDREYKPLAPNVKTSEVKGRGGEYEVKSRPKSPIKKFF